jgi:hypothetical protein
MLKKDMGVIKSAKRIVALMSRDAHVTKRAFVNETIAMQS